MALSLFPLLCRAEPNHAVPRLAVLRLATPRSALPRFLDLATPCFSCQQVSRLTGKEVAKLIHDPKRNHVRRVSPKSCSSAWRTLQRDLELIGGSYPLLLGKFLDSCRDHSDILPLLAVILKRIIFPLTVITAGDNIGL